MLRRMSNAISSLLGSQKSTTAESSSSSEDEQMPSVPGPSNSPLDESSSDSDEDETTGYENSYPHQWKPAYVPCGSAKCKKANPYFPSMKAMREHYKRCHPHEEKWSTKDVPSFRKHDYLTCFRCLRLVSNRPKHLKSCSGDKGDEMTNCPFCYESFTYKELALEHIGICDIAKSVAWRLASFAEYKV